MPREAQRSTEKRSVDRTSLSCAWLGAPHKQIYDQGGSPNHLASSSFKVCPSTASICRLDEWKLCSTCIALLATGTCCRLHICGEEAGKWDEAERDRTEFVYGAGRHRRVSSICTFQRLRHRCSWKPTPSPSRQSCGFVRWVSLMNAETSGIVCFSHRSDISNQKGNEGNAKETTITTSYEIS